MSKKALVILTSGFEEIEAVCPIDILRRAEVDVTVATTGRPIVPGSHGITIEANCELESIMHQMYDAVVLPGGMPNSENLANSIHVEEIVMKHFKAGKIIAAICAAPGLALGKFGILDGKKATCYPGFEKHFPKSATYINDQRVVVDGNLITSRGPGTAFDFGLQIVRTLVDPQLADTLASAMQYN